MNIFRRPRGYFSAFELGLWGVSVVLILAAFLIFDRENYLTLAASLIGATSLIFNAKGNPIGQVLMIIFSLLYGYISFSFAYYGEMITYLGMTAPMAAIALVAWLRNPYKGRRSEVAVGIMPRREWCFMFVLTVAVTAAFYPILAALGTANLLPSALSIATSFAAAYLTFRRSPAFALVYAANDVVLIILWILATLSEPSYLSVVVCFFVFLANDLYGYISWLKMRYRQTKPEIIKNTSSHQKT